MKVERIPVWIGILGLAAQVHAADPASQPPASRDYTNRVQFHNVDLDVSKPGTGDQTGPGLESGLSRTADPDLNALQPSEFVPVARTAPPRKKKEKNWMEVPGTGNGLGKSKEKKESGWGWLADDVTSAEKKRDNKEKDSVDADAADGERPDDESEADEQATTEGGVPTREDRPQNRYVDRRYEPRDAPDIYRESKGASQAVVRVEAAGHQEPLTEPARQGLPEGPSVAGLNPGPDFDAREAGLRAAPVEASGLGDSPGFTPVLSSPTEMPGASDSFQALSPSLGGNAAADAPLSLGWTSSFSDDTAARDDASDSPVRFGQDASRGFGDSFDESRKSALPW